MTSAELSVIYFHSERIDFRVVLGDTENNAIRYVDKLIFMI